MSDTSARLPMQHVVVAGRHRALPAEDVASDHDPLYLVGALVDLRDLRIAHEPFNRILLYVTVSAHRLYAVRRDGHGDVGRVALRYRGPVGDSLVLRIDRVSRAIHGEPRRLDLHRHVGEHELKTLEGLERLAELLTLGTVGRRRVEGTLRDAE